MSAEKVRPIRPEDVANEKVKIFPDEVFLAFNELITQNFSSGYATILQDDIVNRMVSKGLNRSDIYKNGWLDVEDVYRKAGWKVEYDKPGYNESYEPSFKFSRKRQSVNDW
jgi:hypothetical protein